MAAGSTGIGISALLTPVGITVLKLGGRIGLTQAGLCAIHSRE
jgi:hypothetical protein